MKKYDDYTSCLIKTRPGDRVFACFKFHYNGETGPSPHNEIGAIHAWVDVIAAQHGNSSSCIFAPYPLLGTMGPRYCSFWPINIGSQVDNIKAMIHKHRDIKHYTHCYWAMPSHIKILEIDRSNRQS